VIRGKELAVKYVENWKIQAEHSELDQGRGDSLFMLLNYKKGGES
jgi:hypothetical protein